MPRRNLSNGEKLKLISNIENSDYNNFDAQHQYHVSRSTVYRCLSSKDNIICAVENGMGKRARIEKDKHTAHDDIVKKFILDCQTKGIGLKAKFITKYARMKAIEIGRPELNCSKGWYDSFRKRTNLKFGKISGEAKGADLEKVHQWKTETIPRISIDWRSEFIYNCDETALFWRQTPVKTYFISKFDHSGDKLFRERITILFCVNRAGTKEKPLIIGTAKKPRCSFAGWLQNFDVCYSSQPNAWMDRQTFENWLTNWDQRLEEEGKKILLILDNFSGHKIDMKKYNMITFQFLPSQTTSHTQPLDAGIIYSFKSKYLTLFVNYLISNVESGHLHDKVKKINLFNALDWVDSAWKSVTSQTVYNCWSHTGFNNFHEDELIQANNDLSSALMNLSINCCSANDLMNQVTMEVTNYYDFD